MARKTILGNWTDLSCWKCYKQPRTENNLSLKITVPIAVAFSDVCSLVYVRYERDLNDIYVPNNRNGASEAVI